MSKHTRFLYLTFDKPIPYKGLLIHPISMEDYYEFNFLAKCLMLEKNSIPDIKIIAMTYLEYMISINNKENNIVYLFYELLRLSLKKKEDKEFKLDFAIGSDGRPVFIIDGVNYNSDDFDEIRSIIAEQNELSLPDETIQKEVRVAMEEARLYKERMSGNKTASLEDQMIALSLFSGLELDVIYKMPIRKFIRAIKRANHMIYQNIYLQASVSGTVEFKDKKVLSGWLADIESADKYGDVKMDLDTLKGKADFSSAKK